MKTLKWITLLFFSFVLMGCVKTMADENELNFASFHKQAVGSSARDLLTAERFEALKLEIQYMPGARPGKEVITALQSFLKEYTDKPAGISITQSEIPAFPDSVLTLSDVRAIEDKYRTAYSDYNTLAIYILFTNGHSADSMQLGYAYRNTSAVLFGKSIELNSGKFKMPSRTDLEERVLQHEFGHLLGLVNSGAALQSDHQDIDHGVHCNNERCLMYHSIDTHSYPSFLLKKSPPTFDADCIADLKAIAAQKEIVEKSLSGK